MKADNFKSRYFIKILSSVIIAILNIIIQLILPRALSVSEYGIYSYNLNVFTSVVVIANLSTSSAMVSKLSKRNDESGLIFFYIKFYAIMSILLCICISFVHGTKFGKDTFVGQTIAVVLLGLLSSIILKLLTDSVSMYDAFALSRFPAFIQIILKFVICLFILFFFVLGILNLVAFYTVQIIVTGFGVIVLLLIIIKEQKTKFKFLFNRGTGSYVKEFWAYCKPLIIASVISQGLIILMNYALMCWSGVTEQALFGAAWQLNTIVSYIFSPYAELSKREFAVLYKDSKKLKERFIQSLKIIIWITSFFAIYIGIEADWILPVVYGNSYSAASLATLLIMYYTIYQAWGQLNGSYMLALEKSRLSAMIAILSQLMSLCFVFLFQIPNRIWPQGLGAVGIALNYTVTNFISVTLGIYVISKGLGLSPCKILKIQVFPIIFFSLAAICLKYGIDVFLPKGDLLSNIIKILISGTVYSTLFFVLIWKKPEMLGLSTNIIQGMLIRMKNRLT